MMICTRLHEKIYASDNRCPPMEERRRTLLEKTRSDGYDSLVAFTPENLYYMTGFWGEAVGILDEDGVTIVSSALEAQRAADDSYRCNIVTSERGKGMIPSVSGLLQDKNPCTDCCDYSTMRSLKIHSPRMEHNPRPFLTARTIKDNDEISTLRAASRIIDSLFDICAAEMVVGQSEIQLQALLMKYAIDRDMFDTGYVYGLHPLIVAGGPNSAFPHAQPTDRKFQSGDLVVVDITLRHKGYISDATRTFAMGDVSQEALDVYEIVRESQSRGLQAVAIGASCGDVDAACRNYIEERGYGKFFIHSTGHGVGLEVHEDPFLGKGSDTTLQNNMAITVEPGIYLPGKLGVRIEDSLIVGQKPDILHHFPKDMIRV